MKKKQKKSDKISQMVEGFKTEPTLNQLILYVRYKHDKQYDEMSRMFDLHSSNICRRLKKAYRRIKNSLGGKEDEHRDPGLSESEDQM